MSLFHAGNVGLRRAAGGSVSRHAPRQPVRTTRTAPARVRLLDGSLGALFLVVPDRSTSAQWKLRTTATSPMPWWSPLSKPYGGTPVFMTKRIGYRDYSSIRFRRDSLQRLHRCTVRCTKALDSPLQEWCRAPRRSIAHGAAAVPPRCREPLHLLRRRCSDSVP